MQNNETVTTRATDFWCTGGSTMQLQISVLMLLSTVQLLRIILHSLIFKRTVAIAQTDSSKFQNNPFNVSMLSENTSSNASPLAVFL